MTDPYADVPPEDQEDRDQEDRDQGEPQRRARITWANTIEPEPVVWVWEDSEEGRIPAGSLSTAAGREGTGKSSFGIWLDRPTPLQGTLPGSLYGTPRNVFYVAVEDSWKYTLVPRLMAAGADLARVGRFEVISIDNEEIHAIPARPTTALLETSRSLEHDVALVVIDPLLSAIGDHIDTHRSA